MARDGDRREEQAKLVRKSLTIDAEKLERARQHLKASSDAEVLRIALDQLLSQYERKERDEEE